MITLLLLLGTLFNTVSSTSTPCSGTTYSVPFPYGATGSTPNLTVTAGGVTLPYSTGWTVNKVSSTNTGTITLTTACTGTLIITRTTPRTQPTSLRTQGKLDLGALETNLDRLEMQMQESVAQGGAATISTLTLTAPLPQISGGTGVGSLNCGAGFLTSDGTAYSCQVPSGLAVPGTTSVALQAVTPGAAQTGHLNITGTAKVGALRSGSLGADTTAVAQNVGFISPGSGTGVPYTFNVTNALSGAGGGLYMQWQVQGGNFMSIYQSPNTGGSAIITPSTVNRTVCSLSQDDASVYPGMCYAGDAQLNLATRGGLTQVETGGFIIANANTIFRVNNHGVTKFYVKGDGTTTTTGPVVATAGTFSGPVSGTTGSFSSTLGVTGASTLTGGATIGASGTAISGSFRGTVVWNPGTIAAGGTATTNVTVTGAATGSDCIASVLNPAPLSGYPVQCIVTATNTCGLMIVNQSAAGITFGSATFACRVFNP